VEYEIVMSDTSTMDEIDRILQAMEAEHEQLFQAVDRIKEAIGAEDLSIAKHHLMQLQIYQQSHFENESRLMVRYEYPPIEDHEKTHEDLIATLHSINRLISLENLQQLNGALTAYLENSLHHIIEVDRPFQDFLSFSRTSGIGD
jgi:hemerythrin-like metal-binding protein